MTLDYLDGFEHQRKTTANFDSTHGLWTAVSNSGAITFPAGRTGVSLKLVQDGVTATSITTTDLPGSQQRVISFWFWVPSAPSVTSALFSATETGGANQIWDFIVNTSGQIQGRTRFPAYQTGPVISDNAWHRLDFWVDSSGTTYTMKWRVDGVAQTDSTSAGQVARTPVRMIFGSNTATHTLTVEFDDFMAADNGATDYPINSGGDYNIYFRSPIADGTHNAGVDVMEDQAGADIGAVSAFPLLDEIPMTTTDYVRQIAVGGGNYAEVSFADTLATTILAVGAVVVGGAANASSPNGTTRIVDSGGSTLVDLFSGNMGGGSTTDRAVNLKVPAPGGGWTQADFGGLKLRMGFSSNASGSATPRWGGAIIQFAAAGGATVGNIAAVASVPTPVISADVGLTVGNIGAIATIPTPVVTTTAGAFPQVGATNTSFDGSAVTNHTINLPASISAGDLLIVVFGQTAASNIPGFPGGWTRMAFSTADNIGACWAYRYADGLEGATITVTTGAACQAAHWSSRITAHDLTQAPESQSFWDGAATGHPNPPTVLPTGGAKDYLVIVAAVQDSGVVCSAAPASFGNLQTVSSGGTANVSCGVSVARRLVNTSNPGAGDFTAAATTDSWRANTIVVHPVALVAATRLKPVRAIRSAAVQNRSSRW